MISKWELKSSWMQCRQCTGFVVNNISLCSLLKVELQLSLVDLFTLWTLHGIFRLASGWFFNKLKKPKFCKQSFMSVLKLKDKRKIKEGSTVRKSTTFIYLLWWWNYSISTRFSCDVLLIFFLHIFNSLILLYYIMYYYCMQVLVELYIYDYASQCST